MFCAYCGSKNPDDARFCGNCGAAIKVPQQNNASEPVRQSNPAVNKTSAAATEKKKKNSNWVAVLVVLMFCAGCNVALASSDSSSGKAPEQPAGQIIVQTQPAPVVTISEEYRMIFESNGLDVPTTDFSFSDKDVSAYAGVLDGGIVENMEFEHEDGIVLSMVDTVYIPVSGVDETTREQMHLAMMDSLGVYQQMDCCILTHYLGTDHYVYRLEVMDMDDQDNVRMISSVGVITVTDDSELVGIVATENSLLAGGYVKR